MALNVIKTKQQKPRRTLVYGVHGIGKSTFAAKFPNPVFIQTEDGLNDIDTTSVGICRTYAEVISSLGSILSEEHDFKTVAIDSLDWLERIIFAQVCEDKSVSNIEDIGYAKGYTFALNYWKEIFSALEDINNQRDMHVVLIAHCIIEKFEDPSSDNYDRYTPALHKKTSAPMVQQWCDDVLFTRQEVYTQSAGDDFGKKKHKAKAGQRMIYTTELPSHSAKNRAGLPDTIPFDINAAYEYLYNVYGTLEGIYSEEELKAIDAQKA